MEGYTYHATVLGGESVTMRRCECWHHLRQYHPDGVPIAVDNGWVDARKPYPHAKRCEHKRD